MVTAPPAPELAWDTAEEILELITDSALEMADGACETAEDSCERTLEAPLPTTEVACEAMEDT